MYEVEKIGNLVLITLEGDVSEEEIASIKDQLKKVAEVPNDDVVVSFNLTKLKKSTSFEIENRKNELLKFCHLSGLRVYSYRFE
ncbi:MAG: hypothetical protein KAT34_16640 [Candidatus Aminicenantes bacterium]|nr:hypothetical protein [Candidatus Aminicenantes bacterium]